MTGSPSARGIDTLLLGKHDAQPLTTIPHIHGDASAHLRALETELLAMPPVAALQLRIDMFDGERLQLFAPLSANLNDKGCAFGGSLVSLMTLAGWGLVSTRLAAAGLQAEVYVADSEVRYRAPLYADIVASAELAEGESWEVFLATLRTRGRGRLRVNAKVVLPEGSVATESSSRYVAILKLTDQIDDQA